MRKLLLALPLLAAVVIAGCVGQSNTTPPLSTSTSLKIENFAFVPSEITILKGTTLTWTNLDDTQHTVTSDDGKFDSGQLGKGQTFIFAFEETGTFNYHCGNHLNMKATVIVVE